MSVWTTNEDPWLAHGPSNITYSRWVNWEKPSAGKKSSNDVSFQLTTGWVIITLLFTENIGDCHAVSRILSTSVIHLHFENESSSPVSTFFYSTYLLPHNAINLSDTVLWIT